MDANSTALEKLKTLISNCKDLSKEVREAVLQDISLSPPEAKHLRNIFFPSDAATKKD